MRNHYNRETSEHERHLEHPFVYLVGICFEKNYGEGDDHYRINIILGGELIEQKIKEEIF